MKSDKPPKTRFTSAELTSRACRISHPLVSATFVAAIFAVIVAVFYGCDHKGPVSPNPPSPPISSTPSRENIIEAVRHSVEGKTYEVATEREESTVHTCEQYDVDVHRFGCNSIGQTYTTSEAVPARETKHCEPLPGPEHGWQVTETGSDKWRVTLAGSVWDVEKLNGAAISGGGAVNVSSFSFSIQPHQSC